MKKGLLVAFLIVIVFLAFLAVIGGVIYLQLSQEPHVPDQTYLRINIGGMIDDFQENILAKNLSIHDLWYHLARAKIDRRIQGIILKISYIQSGFAKVDDIGRMIKDFRASNKKVFAFLENGGLKELMLASYGDQVYLFKGNSIMINGLSIQAVFLRDSLAKIGIEADFLNIGDYKTGPNMFTKQSLNREHEESLQTLVTDIYDSALHILAKNRSVPETKIKEVIDEFPVANDKYRQLGLVDQIIFEDEILAQNNIPKDMAVTDFSLYAKTSSPEPFEGTRKIAVIFAQGEVFEGTSGKNSLTGSRILGADTLKRQLSMARQNNNIVGVVLRIDSPGGSSVASEIIARSAYLLNREKPLVISMSDLAASGGYLISLPAREIFTLSQSITGSIGVYGGKFVLRDLYKAIGLNKQILKTSRFADMFSDLRKFSPEERVKYHQYMKIVYDRFLASVIRNRKLSPAAAEDSARGRVWSGKKALGLKLADHIGGLVDAVRRVKQLVQTKDKSPVGIITFPRKPGFLEYLLGLLGGKNTPDLDIRQTLLDQLRLYSHFFPAFILPYQITIK